MQLIRRFTGLKFYALFSKNYHLDRVPVEGLCYIVKDYNNFLYAPKYDLKDYIYFDMFLICKSYVHKDSVPKVFKYL